LAEPWGGFYAASHHFDEVFISCGIDMYPCDRLVEMNTQILWKQRGIEVSAHRPEQRTAQDVKHASLILALRAKHKARLLEPYPDAQAKVYTLAEFATGANADIEDAWGEPIDAYERMLGALDTLVPAAIKKAAAP
jgi:protein-tyrosine-phosphatase